MKIFLLMTLIAAGVDARGRKDPSCPEGFYTKVDTRVSGTASASLQRHRFKNPKKFNKYDCVRCRKHTITIVDGLGWNVCLGGKAKTNCGLHAAPVPTGNPNHPAACIPCGPGERQIVFNGEQRCLPHTCAMGTAPARHRGVLETYRCTEPYEDPDLIIWREVTPPAPKTPPETPDCAEGEGLEWEAASKTYSCSPCGAGLHVLRRNGYPVCGRKTSGLCGKREAYLPANDLRGRPRCVKCPKRHRFSTASGVPRCLKALPKKKKIRKANRRVRSKRRGARQRPLHR
ncbi:MAG: hypothetical protein COB53_08855 [Elusimicrobia bacterium]|nr:MAG: hypothetical protein COB53_08855 [Elusimicrobiota bacterium]